MVNYFGLGLLHNYETNMTTISVHMEASESRGHHTFDLEDLNLTEEQWEAMPNNERGDAIQRAVDTLPEQPYWIFTHFAE